MYTIQLCLLSMSISLISASLPIVINTWTFTEATASALAAIQKNNNAIDALTLGCSTCEELQCDGTVGYGGSPDENGETTLDALIFDGATMDMGAVGALRRVKSAIAVAKDVLLHTSHSLLVGDQATEFAIEMDYKEESLSTNTSRSIWKQWKENNCQPNYWKEVFPDNKKVCGPYKPLSENSIYYKMAKNFNQEIINDIERNHDTIGMVVIDTNKNVVAGTSTNGLRHKIPGRVGDSPIPGAGAYADNEVGGAAATGDGDIMMRFLPSFLAVEEMRRGSTPTVAAEIAIKRIVNKYPNFMGAVIAINRDGEFAAACNGMKVFPFSVGNADGVKLHTSLCKNDT